MEGFEARIKENTDGFSKCMRDCVEYLGRRNIFEAIQCVDRAIWFESESDKIFEEMERMGIFLKGLTKRDYKAMKKEKKAA